MLTTGDAAPDIEKVVALFHFRRCRRMVRADRGDVAELRMELVLFVARTKRRRAFGDGAEPFHVALAQDQLMRTGLAGHVDASGACFGDDRNAAPATAM